MTTAQATPDRREQTNTLRHITINFDSFDEARQFAKDNGGKVCLFSKRDGHDYWQNHGEKLQPLTSDDYLHNLGDNYQEYDEEGVKELYKEALTDAVAQFDFDWIQLLMHNYEKLEEEVNDDKAVIMQGRTHYETVDREMMSYHEDVTTYIIGVDTVDYTENFDLLPNAVQNILQADEKFTYDECEEVKQKLEAIGWTCDYELNAEIYNLRRL